MSCRVNHFAPTLRRLNRLSESSKKRWLKTNVNKDFIHCICECVQNLLRGKVPLNKKQKSVLVRRKKTLRELVRRKVNLTRKKKIIQSGGFLGALLGPIVSILGGLLGNNQ
jgi:hypothetical protein